MEDHRSQGFWYDWIHYAERFDKTDERQLVKCGDSMPILWTDRPEGALLGYLDNKTEIAWFAHDKKVEQVTGNALSSMLILVRQLKGGPPTCSCSWCSEKPVERVMYNEWTDLRVGDDFPVGKAIRALDRPLQTLPGEQSDQFVALWYQQGEPVMGRVWNDKGKVAACFSWGNHEYRGHSVGSVQVLTEIPEHMRGFDYKWIDFKEAARFDLQAKEWHPVHVDNRKYDISPAVLIIDGREILGKVDVRNERATAGHGKMEKVLVGPAVHSCKVLCRKAKPGCKFD